MLPRALCQRILSGSPGVRCVSTLRGLLENDFGVHAKQLDTMFWFSPLSKSIPMRLFSTIVLVVALTDMLTTAANMCTIVGE